MRRLITAVALAVGLLLPTVAVTAAGVADPEPAAAHSAITAPAYDVCAWTGVSMGLLGGGGVSLVQWYRFWYVDHYWVYCKIRWAVTNTEACWIVSTHDGTVVWLGYC